MKKDIHPEYYKEAVITCSCGNKMTVGSTQKEMRVEVCSECHPFYTGAEKVMDTAGRVEKFKARAQAAGNKKQSKKKADNKGEEAINEKQEQEGSVGKTNSSNKDDYRLFSKTHLLPSGFLCAPIQPCSENLCCAKARLILRIRQYIFLLQDESTNEMRIYEYINS